MLSLLLLSGLAQATSSFDPTTVDGTCTGAQTTTLDGGETLWARIERHVDPQPDLFGPQDFNAGTEWPADSAFAPFIRDCFGTGRPDAGAFLLHVGLGIDTAQGTPVLFVPGAGDNASRGFARIAMAFADAGRPSFALTFSHPHGDVFDQAEVVADALARIRTLTGADDVDVVSHSKGGIATAVYLSHTASTSWPDAAYVTHGTPYADDVRRAVWIGSPLGGIDTAFRWPANNFASLTAETAIAPTSWTSYYPLGTAFPLNVVDLGAQDFFADGGDLFPGQRQILHPQDAPLPGSMPWLGAYAVLQQDWYTTWHGGFGFTSYSPGLDATVDAGGGLIGLLEARGVDPSVDLYLLAGSNPLLANGTSLLIEQTFGEVWADLAAAGPALWGDLLADVWRLTPVDFGVTDEELAGLASGALILGELTAPSDGLVFVDSATHAEALTARGATVSETRVVDLAHLDLLAANPTNAARLYDEAADNPLADGWKASVADRYLQHDTVAWLLEVLADPAGPPVDTGAPASDTADPVDDSDLPASGDPADADPKTSGACAHGPGPAGGGGLAVALGLIGLRRRWPRS